MNRDYTLAKTYDSQIADLQPWQASIFAAGVLEHVVPLLDPRGFRGRAQSTMDALLAAGVGRHCDRASAARLRQDVSSSIPQLGEDPSLKGEYLRNGGEVLLEALDYLLTRDARRVSASSAGVFGLLTVAIDFLLKRDPGVWEELGEFAGADPVLPEEWSLHQHMLKELALWPDARQLLAWRHRRRHRSEELLSYFGLGP